MAIRAVLCALVVVCASSDVGAAGRDEASRTPASLPSWISIPVQIDLTKLEALANQQLPSRFEFHQAGDWAGGAIADETITAAIRREALRFSADGPHRIRAETRLLAERLAYQGRVLFFNGSLVSRDLSARVIATAEWRIRPEAWRPEVTATSVAFHVDRAFINGNILGIRVNTPFRGLAQDALNGHAPRLADQLRRSLQTALDRAAIKAKVEAVSQRLQRGVEVASEPKTFVRLVPLGAYYSGWEQRGHMLTARIALKCDINVHIGQERPKAWDRVRPLPRLEVRPAAELGNGFELRVPVEIEAEEIRRLFNRALARDRTLEFDRGKVSVGTLSRFSVREDGQLELEARDVAVEYQGRHFSIPRVVVPEVRLALRVDWDDTSKRVVLVPSTAAEEKTLDGFLLRALVEMANFELQRAIGDELATAHAQLNRLAKDLASRWRESGLSVHIDKVLLQEIRLSKDGIIVVGGTIRGYAVISVTDRVETISANIAVFVIRRGGGGAHGIGCWYLFTRPD